MENLNIDKVNKIDTFNFLKYLLICLKEKGVNKIYIKEFNEVFLKNAFNNISNDCLKDFNLDFFNRNDCTKLTEALFGLKFYGYINSKDNNIYEINRIERDFINRFSDSTKKFVNDFSKNVINDLSDNCSIA